MSDKGLLWLILIVVAVDLYIDYRVAKGLQGASDAVDKIRKNPIAEALGL